MDLFQVTERARRSLGMVVPVYFPQSVPQETQRQFLWATLHGAHHFVRPEHILLVVDGVSWVRPAVEEVRRMFAEEAGAGFEVLWLDQNQGKGGAICRAFEEILRVAEIDRVCIRDDDADHSIYDLPEALLLYERIAQAEETELIVVNGRRANVRRVLGLARGEFELLMDRVAWETLRFYLARRGRAPNEQWFCAYPEPPDIESGYKLYSRRAATLLVEGLTRAARWDSAVPILRFGVEIVPAVECLVAGGVLGEIMRTAAEAPPLTTFGRGATLAELFGAEARWLFYRLEIPAQAAGQILRNAIARCPLLHLDEGREALAEFYRRALADLAEQPELNLALPPRF